MNLTKEQREHYFHCYKTFQTHMNGNSSSPIQILRQKGIDEFLNSGFPAHSDEEWRFTNITPISRMLFHPQQQSESALGTGIDISAHVIPDIDSIRLTFINGIYIPELSNTVSGIYVATNLANILKNIDTSVNQIIKSFSPSENNPFDYLNSGFLNDGAYIAIPDNFISDKPIYCLFIAAMTPEPALIQPRNIFITGKNSRVSIIEQYISLAHTPYLTNTITQISAAENSSVEHTKLQMEGPKAYHVGSTRIEQQANSNVISHSIMIGGSIVRNNVSSRLGGTNAECTMNGLTLARSNQMLDNHTTIDHAQPHCNSHELFKSILDDNARGVFNGKIYVRKDAQKTDAKQTNKTLLLSDHATMNTKPQLEIFADDVKCTHGATIGYLDSEMIFYLRSRGISLEAARDLLIHAFASDITERVSNPQVRRYVDAIIFQRLESTI